MFCVSCGNEIDDGELICKGCRRLSANERDEILAASEKLDLETSGRKCKNCGGDIGEEHNYCNTCGSPTSL